MNRDSDNIAEVAEVLLSSGRSLRYFSASTVPLGVGAEFNLNKVTLGANKTLNLIRKKIENLNPNNSNSGGDQLLPLKNITWQIKENYGGKQLLLHPNELKLFVRSGIKSENTNDELLTKNYELKNTAFEKCRVDTFLKLIEIEEELRERSMKKEDLDTMTKFFDIWMAYQYSQDWENLEKKDELLMSLKEKEHLKLHLKPQNRIDYWANCGRFVYQAFKAFMQKDMIWNKHLMNHVQQIKDYIYVTINFSLLNDLVIAERSWAEVSHWGTAVAITEIQNTMCMAWSIYLRYHEIQTDYLNKLKEGLSDGKRKVNQEILAANQEYLKKTVKKRKYLKDFIVKVRPFLNETSRQSIWEKTDLAELKSSFQDFYKNVMMETDEDQQIIHRDVFLHFFEFFKKEIVIKELEKYKKLKKHKKLKEENCLKLVEEFLNFFNEFKLPDSY